MFNEYILYILYRKYIKQIFLISNMHCYKLHLKNFNGDFLNISIFLHPQIPDFQKSSYPNKPYINGKLIYTAFRWSIYFNLNQMYPYDWLCGPGLQIILLYILYNWYSIIISKPFQQTNKKNSW